MRAINHHIGARSMTLVTGNVDVAATFKQVVSRLRQKCRHGMCSMLHGGHELYRARTATKLYQECLLCGYETPGWTIDRRDRRLHLVNAQPSSAISRR